MKLLMKIVKIWIKWNWCFRHALGNARNRGGCNVIRYIWTFDENRR